MMYIYYTHTQQYKRELLNRSLHDKVVASGGAIRSLATLPPPEGRTLYSNDEGLVKDGVYVKATYIRLFKTKVENSPAEKECP